MRNRLILFFVLGWLVNIVHATSPTMHAANIEPNDKASLQRGAKIFMNYCSGCHSLQYLTYRQLGEDLSIKNRKGELAENIVKKNLIFTNAKLDDPILSALSSEDAQKWFGKMPPDLSLVTKVRGVEWVYTYMHSFYRDDKAIWGSNNWLLHGTAMPNVLGELQGEQIPVFRREEKESVIDHLLLVEEGKLTHIEFDQVLSDLINFLNYVAEPTRMTRMQLGGWVIAFLVILFIPVYLLKKEYWKSIR